MGRRHVVINVDVNGDVDVDVDVDINIKLKSMKGKKGACKRIVGAGDGAGDGAAALCRLTAPKAAKGSSLMALSRGVHGWQQAVRATSYFSTHFMAAVGARAFRHGGEVFA